MKEPEAAQLRESNTNIPLETLRALVFLESALKDKMGTSKWPKMAQNGYKNLVLGLDRPKSMHVGR